MVAYEKITKIYVRVVLDAEDIRLYREDEVAFARKLREIVETVKGGKVQHFGYQPVEIYDVPGWLHGEVNAWYTSGARRV